MLRIKRLLPILLAIALIISLAACTGATTTTTKATTTAAGTQAGTTAATTAATTTVGKPVKITVELLDFGNIPEGQGTWEITAGPSMLKKKPSKSVSKSSSSLYRAQKKYPN